METFSRFTLAAAGSIAIHGSALAAESKPGSNQFIQYCLGCHSMYCNREGPKLGGLIGRKAGSVPDYKGYSDAMKSAGFVWTLDKLDKFLQTPEAVVPGGKMENEARATTASKDERQKILQFVQDPDNSAEICR